MLSHLRVFLGCSVAVLVSTPYTALASLRRGAQAESALPTTTTTAVTTPSATTTAAAAATATVAASPAVAATRLFSFPRLLHVPLPIQLAVSSTPLLAQTASLPADVFVWPISTAGPYRSRSRRTIRRRR